MTGNEPPSLTVVIPTLNESDRIGGLLRELRRQDPGIEIWVVDGGSSDDTASVAAPWANVVSAERGRARQMNAGAARASGGVLWFLHADSTLCPDAAERVARCMSDGSMAGGCFRLTIPARGMAYRLCDDWGNLGVALFGLACGDHGIFIRRSVFEAVGGYPDVPLMEDAELYRRMRRFGATAQLPAAIVTSPRRWQAHGPWRVTRAYLLIWALYLAGAPMASLERVYRRVR